MTNPLENAFKQLENAGKVLKLSKKKQLWIFVDVEILNVVVVTIFI